MCGIVGVVHGGDDNPPTPDLIQRMLRLLAHRGPDDEGVWVRGPVGLGHRRLAIIDLSASGHQPMGNEDETVWIVFNGEIYNSQQLRRTLEARGHRFRSNTDTEAIVHLYEEVGDECVSHLRGMFAFGLWDGNRQRLLCARDRLGKKPLVYWQEGDRFSFASEIRALLAHPRVPRRVNDKALDYYLTLGYVPAPLSAFAEIRKLPPAHYLLWERGTIRQERYWRLDCSHKLQLSEEEYCEEILRRLEEATRLRLVSDVPLGAFLSGGLDSSAVVAMMARLSGRPVKTFAIGFSSDRFNELPYARLVANHFKTEHVEFVVEPRAAQELPRLVWHYSEPFADSSALPTYYVSRLTREHVTVALNGDGGDESFAGYGRYAAMLRALRFQRLPASLRKPILAPLMRLPSRVLTNAFSRRLAVAAEKMAAHPHRLYAMLCPTFLDHQAKASLYSDAFAARCAGEDGLDLIRSRMGEAGTSRLLDAMMWTDIHSYLPDDLLVKMDIASMANSLESRSPLLDHEFVEFAAQIPPELKYRDGVTKYIFRKALGGLLPEPILARGKAGFAIPVNQWFRGELGGPARRLLLSSTALDRGYFREEGLRRLLDEHAGGRNHGPRLWALVCLELWFRIYFDQSDLSRWDVGDADYCAWLSLEGLA